MAKRLIRRPRPIDPSGITDTQPRRPSAIRPSLQEYDLIDDVVFDPPLTPEERRRRGVGISIEERLEQARRQLAEGEDGM